MVPLTHPLTQEALDKKIDLARKILSPFLPLYFVLVVSLTTLMPFLINCGQRVKPGSSLVEGDEQQYEHKSQSSLVSA